MSYENFYKSFNLIKFPFNTYTTEQELDLAKDLFIPQGEYAPIVDAFKSNKTIILYGERGSGKTAILEDFKRNINYKKKAYTMITDFSMIDDNPDSSEVYRLLLTNLLIELFSLINKKIVKALFLNKEDKILLSYLLLNFLPPISQTHLKEKISNIQFPIIQRGVYKIYNLFRKPLNFTGTVGKNVLYQYFLKHYSFLPVIETEDVIHNFFPELKLNIDMTFFDQEISYNLITKVGKIFTKLGFDKPIIFIDRMDEDTRLCNDAEKISEFITPFLTDNQLLSSNSIQLIYFVWSTPFRYIRELVRTQKYYCPPLNWTIDDLKRMINKRLSIFSNKKISDYKLLFDEAIAESELDKIFELANSNPRDILHIFKTLFDEQYNYNSSSNKIEMNIIEKSLSKFVLNFNYYEYYPRKANARADSMDVYSYSAYLLKLDNKKFTKNQLNEKAKLGGSLQNYVTGMEKIGLIENIGTERGVINYQIKDSKIVYALEKGLEIKKK